MESGPLAFNEGGVFSLIAVHQGGNMYLLPHPPAIYIGPQKYRQRFPVMFHSKAWFNTPELCSGEARIN
jgi:hypothetical protein